MHDPETGAILEVNDAAVQQSGYTRDEILRLNVADLSNGAPPYDQTHARRKLAAAMEQGPQVFERQSRRKNGALVWVEAAC